MSAYIKSYGIFDVELMDHKMIDGKQHFIIWINNTNTNQSECISRDYSPSPFLTTLSEICDDAVNIISGMAIEWYEDKRSDEPIFEEVYNQLSNIMTNKDIENLYYETLRK
jgi:hypothetical protein